MTAPGLAVVWDDRFLDYSFGPDHPFTERSRELGVRLLRALVPPDSDRIEWIDRVEPASRAVLESFHRPEYLESVAAASRAADPPLLDAGDTPGFPGCYEASARLVAATDRALDLALSGNRPAFQPGGGLHHARPERASGFCIFNDVAIAIARSLREGRRVAYIDIDAHHGDGVMYGFYDSGRVLDIDFHQDGRTLFPGTGFPSETGRGDGAGLKVNVPLPPGAGDAVLLPIFRRIVPPLLRSFRPDVLVVQHGIDGHYADILAHLHYTRRAYIEMDRTLFALSREVSAGRLLVTGGGGYRHATVSRSFARAALIFSGGDPPDNRTELPEEWRRYFASRTGEPAPRTWGENVVAEPSGLGLEIAEGIVGALEKELGQRFPRPD